MRHDVWERGEPPDRVYRGFVRRVKPLNDILVGVNSPVFWGAWVHWMGRSLPCLRDRQKCPYCKLGQNRKYLGYLFVRNEKNGKLEHLELPLDACHDLLDLIGGTQYLRGTRFAAARIGKKTGRIQFDLKERIETVAPGYQIPDDKAPDEILDYLWGINQMKLRLSQDSSLPEREAV